MKKLWQWLKSLFSKEEEVQNSYKGKSALVSKGKLKKKVSEMTPEQKRFHFFEQRVLWLSKHGYAVQFHLGKNEKREKAPSHFRGMMKKIHKLTGDDQVLKKGNRRFNRQGIDLSKYPTL
jgi:hypothetical protein